MALLVTIVALVAFRKEIRSLFAGTKLILAASTGDLITEAKNELRKIAKAQGMPDWDKASIEDVQAFLASK